MNDNTVVFDGLRGLNSANTNKSNVVRARRCKQRVDVHFVKNSGCDGFDNGVSLASASGGWYNIGEQNIGWCIYGTEPNCRDIAGNSYRTGGINSDDFIGIFCRKSRRSGCHKVAKNLVIHTVHLNGSSAGG